MNQHLSPQQIDESLIGERTAEVESHLRVCQACADEVEQAAGSLTLFGGAVRNWGSEQMEGLRAPRMPATAPLSRMNCAIGASAAACASDQMPRSCAVMPASAATAAASVNTSAAPPTAKRPSCTRCQGSASPSVAQEYWHIGDTSTRCLSCTERRVKGSKS